MSDAAAREWRFYIDDMIAFAEKVIAYTDGFDRDGPMLSALHIRKYRGVSSLPPATD